MTKITIYSFVDTRIIFTLDVVLVFINVVFFLDIIINLELSLNVKRGT